MLNLAACASSPPTLIRDALRLVHRSIPWLLASSSREKPPRPRTHRRIAIVTRRVTTLSVGRGLWAFPSGVRGSARPTHPHASCDQSYTLTLRIRSKLTLSPIVSSSTPKHDAAEDPVSSTWSPLSRIGDLLHELVPYGNTAPA